MMKKTNEKRERKSKPRSESEKGKKKQRKKSHLEPRNLGEEPPCGVVEPEPAASLLSLRFAVVPSPLSLRIERKPFSAPDVFLGDSDKPIKEALRCFSSCFFVMAPFLED